jgi:hypothetical protein
MQLLEQWSKELAGLTPVCAEVQANDCAATDDRVCCGQLVPPQIPVGVVDSEETSELSDPVELPPIRLGCASTARETMKRG